MVLTQSKRRFNHDSAATTSLDNITPGTKFKRNAASTSKSCTCNQALARDNRATKSAWTGLFGFTKEYNFVFEANAVVFVTDRLALAAEYRQKPNAYTPVPGLIRPEDDWWTIDAAYVVSKHFTVAAGYGHFGQVLNHEANGAWGITTKWEF